MRYKLLFFATVASISIYAKSSPKVNKVDTNVQKTVLVYDVNTLRVPGNTLPIGVLSFMKKGSVSRTKGLLNGYDGWMKYKIEVIGGTFKNGDILIGGDGSWKKNDSITVKVYSRKWFLGGKDKLLLTKKIPYNYETGIKILTQGNYLKAPGDHIQFGIRTFFDNKTFTDKWAPVNKNLQDFVLREDGSHISKSMGDLKIDEDPYKIRNDRAGLIAKLAKDTLITDTLQIKLDYAATYQCAISSSAAGHNLNVTAEAYDDSIIHARLMKVSVYDNDAKKAYNYIINTKGGSISISSQGASGANGAVGTDGAWGDDGTAGDETTNTQTVVNSDGSTSNVTTTTQGPGGNGDNGGDGGNGGDGSNGYNGGDISISYTTAAQPYLSLLTVNSIPGAGGHGGRGGNGGRGGLGGVGTPFGMAGNSGANGTAGANGTDGVKGKVVYTLAK